MTLKEYRDQMTLSQEELARRSGVPIKLIQDIEDKRIRSREISEDVAMRLVLALHVTVDELLGAILLDNGTLIFIDEFEWFAPKQPEG